MKRRPIKLQLGRETLRILAQPPLRKVRGGTYGTGTELCLTGDWWGVSFCENTCAIDSNPPCQ